MGRSDQAATPPPVSVVVVNYNAGGLLQACLQALFASTIEIELLLVDNASTDNSLEQALAAFPEVRPIRNHCNLGFARAVNQGLELARGDYLLVLNPDCLVQPDTLEKMVATLAAHPEAGMAGCRILDPDGSEQRGCRRHLPDMGNSLAKALGRQQGRTAMDLHRTPLPTAPQPVEAISGAFMLIRPRALAQVGLLDEGYFLHCEDLDWCKRFHDHGWQILFVPEVTVIHHQGSCSRRHPVRVSWHKHQGMIRYYRKHLASAHNPLVRGAIISSIYLRFLATLGKRQ